MDMYKTELFPFLSGEMLNGSQWDMTMADVKAERMPDHRGEDVVKRVLYFTETEKGLILNKTNAETIIRIYGRHTEEWQGKQITLFSEEVQAFGKTYNAVRVKATAPKSKGKPPPDRVTTPAPLFPDTPQTELEGMPAVEPDNALTDS